MRFQKTVFLLVAAMACFTVPASAQTTDSIDVSREAKTAEAGTTSNSGGITSSDSAAKETAPPVASASSKRDSSPAPDPRPQTGSSDKWQFQIAPYLFLIGISGDIGVNGLSTEADPSAGDVLNALNFGFMGAFEARKNKFSILTDLMYASLEKSKATSGPLFSGITAKATAFLFSPQVGYRLAEKEGASLDAVVGIRFWHLSHRLSFNPGLLPAAEQEGSKNWADVIAGLRGQVHLAKRVFVLGRGDFGGGGSDFTYQLFGGVGVDVARNASLVLGYRHLNIKYDRDGFLFDGALHGAVLGATFRF